MMHQQHLAVLHDENGYREIDLFMDMGHGARTLESKDCFVNSTPEKKLQFCFQTARAKQTPPPPRFEKHEAATDACHCSHPYRQGWHQKRGYQNGDAERGTNQPPCCSYVLF